MSIEGNILATILAKTGAGGFVVVLLPATCLQTASPINTSVQWMLGATCMSFDEDGIHQHW